MSKAIYPDEIIKERKETKRKLKIQARREKSRRKKAITPSEAAYVGERLKPGTSKVKAARAAGLTRVPSRPIVQETLQKELRKQMSLSQLTAERVLLEMMRMGLVDPDGFYGEDGEPLPPYSMPEDTRRALNGFEVRKTTITKDDYESTTVVYKVHFPKERVLSMLAEHFNLLKGVGDESQRDKLKEMVAAIQAPFYAAQKEAKK